MALVRSESVTLLVARETTLGTLPTAGWQQLQPNPGGITDFQPILSAVERDPLSKFRTREKGDNVGLDASPKIGHDLNKDLVDFFGSDIFYATAKHVGGTGQSVYRPTAVTGTAYTVPVNGALVANRLVYARGFNTAGNNGVKVVGAGSGATNINASGLTAEAAPPSNATVEVVGVQGASGDITINASGNITSTALDFTTLGLTVGQWVKVGGGTVDAAASRFNTTAYNGYAKITAIAANLLTLERRSWTVGALDAGAAKTIWLLFSRFYRNVSTDHADYLVPSSTLELEEPGAGAAGVSTFTYAKGSTLKTFELDAPLESKITASLTFVGTDIADPVVAASRATGANAALLPLATSLLDTSTDLSRVRLATASTDAALAAEINSWKLTIENNTKPRKQQGTFGAAGMIDGKIEPTLSMEAYYTTDEIPKALRDNRTCWWDACIRNEQCGMIWDMPAVSLRRGSKSYAANEAVMVSLESPAFRDPATNIVASLSVFGYFPRD